MSFKETLDLTGLPCVTFEQGDKKFNFLLDSGSTDSIIDSNIIKEINHKKINRKFSLVGLDGIKRKTDLCEIPLWYKTKEYVDIFLISDMSSIFGDIKKECGANLHGIIGTSFMDKYKYVLDFQKLIAYSKK